MTEDVEAADHAAAADLAETVRKLQRELVSLREALELRAVIEQAKGVLMSREHIDASTAFDRLRETSQAENARLVDVAATLLGVSLPESARLEIPDEALSERLSGSAETSARWARFRDEPDVQAGRAGAVAQVLAEGADDGAMAAEFMRDLLVADGVSAVSLWRLVPDGSLRQLGQCGFASDVATPWQHVPLSVDIPATRAVRDGKPVFLESRSRVVAEFPLLAEGLGHEALAAIPVPQDAPANGCVGLSWAEPHDFTLDQQGRLSRIVARVGDSLLRDLTPAESSADHLPEVLDLSERPWMMLRAAEDSMAGLVIEATSTRVRGSQEWEGQQLLAVFPDLARDNELTEALTRLLHRGGRGSLDCREHPESAPWAEGSDSLRMLRTGQRLILSW